MCRTSLTASVLVREATGMKRPRIPQSQRRRGFSKSRTRRRLPKLKQFIILKIMHKLFDKSFKFINLLFFRYFSFDKIHLNLYEPRLREDEDYW